MNNTKFLALLLLLSQAACNSLQAADEENKQRWFFGRDEPVSNSVTGRQEGELRFQDINRTYLLYTPASYSATKATPLVVVLHGGHGDAEKTFARTGFHGIADKEGFIVVYPEAVGDYWNDGRETTADAADDVAFINVLIDHVGKQRNIDARRVYVTGLSNGGIMTQRLACDLPHRFAAFASVIANIPVSLRDVCKPNQPVALMLINGSADQLMPTAGGEIKTSRWMGVGGTVLSTQQTAQFWVDINRCDNKPVVTRLPDRDPADGTLIDKMQYSGCKQGGEVVQYMVDGGGHTWPGSTEKPFFQRISGKTSNDMIASEVIWAFFSQHSAQ